MEEAKLGVQADQALSPVSPPRMIKAFSYGNKNIPKGIKGVIYSFETFPGLLNKISKLSTYERKYLLKSEVLDQEKVLRIRFAR